MAGPNPFSTTSGTRVPRRSSSLFSERVPEVQQYHDAAGTRGRLPGVRGQAENMTLNIHGQWGILGRLDRAEALLRSLVASL